MGSPGGHVDEAPVSRVVIEAPFYMGTVEVTNRQYGQFDPGHDSGYLDRQHWRDRPHRARSSIRLAYAPWQPVFNVGFPVVCVAE